MLKNHFLDLRTTIIRFPLSYICVALLVSFSVNINHGFYLINKDLTANLFYLLIVGIIWFISARLYIENLHQHYSNKYLLLSVIIFSVISYHILVSDDIEFMITFLPGLILFFSGVPFFPKKDNDLSFWYFNLSST
jgi:hypothetical protein